MTNPTAADDDNDDSPFNRLPGEIVLHILNKLIDLKTLCFCKLVSPRFYSIVHQVDTISFTCDGGLPSTGPCFDFISAFESLRNFTTLKSVSMKLPYDFHSPAFDIMIACFKSDSFFSAIKSMNKFTRLKSLSIKLLFSKSQEEEDKSVHVDYNRYLFKWNVKLLSTNMLDSFYLLLPNSIYRCDTNTNNSNGNGDDENEGDKGKKLYIALRCLSAAIGRFYMLFGFALYFPLMENVSVTDSAQRGTVSISGEKLTELSNWIQSYSPSDIVEKRIKLTFEKHCRISLCHIPLLELPVSGYVMKGVNLYVFESDDLPYNGNYSSLNVDEHDVGFEDKEVDAAYTEAVIEIFKKHRGKIVTL